MCACETGRYEKRGNSSGFTLVELIVVSAIVGVLVGLVVPIFFSFAEKVKITRAITEIRGIEKSVLANTVDSNTLPNSLNDIGLGSLRDPWGNLYQYVNIVDGGAPKVDGFLVELNNDFDIYSVGPNGLTDLDITTANSLDDIVRTREGGWIGKTVDFF